ncbi:RNA polymerase sigma factor SigJ [Streptomyces cocklensis]|uniref:RNA polymerase sigma-70 factor, ECF subfamily n=1 Tax=Actinacidiphila cocklensis TaxID=887465 RepID=A0A9W4GU61_9ACTN|nr:RNA polymerase sigma factor SigJ [Actinacidiphila cocklensis]MDD1059711.1 RNA polymerase sigma factor SigJ [Actinacidiphila cocklensis]CAG6396983.1 RNA polymerase sigma-70 factor, ECF subfamily [Actinacidiphila cocklensis]
MSDTPTRQLAAAPDNRATAVFVSHRELLFSVAYNMLGSVSDTEDVLQETWLAWTRRSGRQTGADIENPRAYLVRIAVNQALARQASISRRRETYVGPWLPEPLATGAQQTADQPQAAEAADVAESALRSESVSMAMLVVLETLTPLERAVFVLHEVFGYPHTEIAEILERSPSAIRQLAHRAREHVQARRPRYQADRRLQRQVTERFIAAALGGDLTELMSLLAPEVTLWTDGGGKANAALRPVSGQEKVAKLITGYAANRLPESVDIRYRQVNGDPSVVVFSGDSPTAVMVVDLDADSDRVTDIYLVTNPDKLSGVSPQEGGPAGP